MPTAKTTLNPAYGQLKVCLKDCPRLDDPINLSSHKAPAVRKMIEATGASLLYIPPYSPDFNPIDQAFSKLKAHLRKAAECTIHGLWDAIGRILDLYSPDGCANYFANAGHDAD